MNTKRSAITKMFQIKQCTTHFSSYPKVNSLANEKLLAGYISARRSCSSAGVPITTSIPWSDL
jgi:hypothetical protein